MKRNSVLLCAAALLLLLTGVLSAQSDPQQSGDQRSLAAAAKQKPAAKAKRVITNDEIPPSPEANNPPPTASGAAAASGSAARPPASDTKKPGDKTATAAEKQTRLQQLMKDRDDLQNVMQELQRQLDSTTDENRIAALTPMLQHAKDSMAETEAEIDKLKASGAAAAPGGKPAATAPAPPAPK